MAWSGRASGDGRRTTLGCVWEPWLAPLSKMMWIANVGSTLDVDVVQEGAEVDRVVASTSVGDRLGEHLTACTSKRCGQRGDAVTLAALAASSPAGRGGVVGVFAALGLDRGLLVDRQHQRPLRRVEVQAADVADPFPELGVVTPVEPAPHPRQIDVRRGGMATADCHAAGGTSSGTNGHSGTRVCPPRSRRRDRSFDRRAAVRTSRSHPPTTVRPRRAARSHRSRPRGADDHGRPPATRVSGWRRRASRAARCPSRRGQHRASRRRPRRARHPPPRPPAAPPRRGRAPPRRRHGRSAARARWRRHRHRRPAR